MPDLSDSTPLPPALLPSLFTAPPSGPPEPPEPPVAPPAIWDPRKPGNSGFLPW